MTCIKCLYEQRRKISDKLPRLFPNESKTRGNNPKVSMKGNNADTLKNNICKTNSGSLQMGSPTNKNIYIYFLLPWYLRVLLLAL